jgi:hypothetical protein
LQVCGSTLHNPGEGHDLLDAVATNRLQPGVDSRCGVADAHEALARLEGQRQFGKVVVERPAEDRSGSLGIARRHRRHPCHEHRGRRPGQCGRRLRRRRGGPGQQFATLGLRRDGNNGREQHQRGACGESSGGGAMQAVGVHGGFLSVGGSWISG